MSPRMLNKTLDGAERFHVAQETTRPSRSVDPALSRSSSRVSKRTAQIETEVVERQRITIAFVIIMMLIHNARPAPFPESAPAKRTGLTRRPNQIECPRGMRLSGGISWYRGLSNGQRETADFGHYMKRDQEV